MKNKEQKNTESLYDIITTKDLVDEKLGGWIRRAEDDEQVELSAFKIGDYVFDVKVWTEGAKPHHLTPPMRDEDRKVLEASIASQGVHETVTITDKGDVPDGFHRINFWYQEVLKGNILPPPPFRLVRFHSVEAEKEFVMSQNFARRQINNPEKEEVLRQLLRDGHPGTDSWLGSKVGLDDETVTEIRVTLENLPITKGGIEFKDCRLSEAGKKYSQKRKEPTTQKRRKEANITEKKTVKAIVDHEKKNLNRRPEREADLDQKTDEEKPDEVIVDDDSTAIVEDKKEENTSLSHQEIDVDDDLKQLVEDWWGEFQFLPAMSKELAALTAKREDRKAEKKDADRLTRMLKSKIGENICGHLILHRTMSAGVAVFMLAPTVSMNSVDLDWKALNSKAGKKADG